MRSRADDLVAQECSSQAHGAVPPTCALVLRDPSAALSLAAGTHPLSTTVTVRATESRNGI